MPRTVLNNGDTGLVVRSALNTMTSELFSAMLNQFFGDGSDGDVTVSGPVTLTRDMYYRNLTLSAGAALNTGGFRIFATGTVDLSAAPAGAIQYNGTTGNTAVVNAAGVQIVTMNGSGVFSGGANANATAGSAAAATTATAVSVAPYAGTSGASGAAGAGSSGAGGAAVTPAAPTAFSFRRAVISEIVISTPGRGGMTGQPGSGGGGDGTAGGGGGGAPPGPPGISIYANTITRGASTAAGAIQNKGGAGGGGGTPAGGNRGGGGGAGGASGGYVYIVTTSLSGSAKAGAVDVSGGNGGNGGNGTGTGVGGNGGSSGGGGRLTVINLTTGVVTETIGSSTSNAGTAAVLLVGGTGGVASTVQLSL